VLGREKGEGSCFAFQLGRCRGACVGKEPLGLHDARLQLALASLRLKPWPFPGPVGIREPGPGGTPPVLHVIDRWQHLGTARDPAEVDGLTSVQSLDGFDADNYRLLGRCLERIHRRDLVLLERRR
jgi:DNA polymerase-3 subunit epsilon